MTLAETYIITNSEKIATISADLFELQESAVIDPDTMRDLIFELHQTIYPGKWATRGR